MTALLEIAGIDAFYGASQALFGMELAVPTGGAVALLGRNGMGKTTTIRAILGLVVTRGGAIHLGGRRIDRLPTHRIARAGIGLVPEGRQIFPNLTVRENLVATAAGRRAAGRAWTLDRVWAFFPRLRERQGNMGDQLSGGEQQMLAIGRALMTGPLLLVLDEATEGLAPLMRHEIWTCLARLRGEGMAILVVDKDVEALARLCDRHVILERGRCVWSGDSTELLATPALTQRYLGIGPEAE